MKKAQSTTQHPLLSLRSPLNRLCLVAASKTSSTPSPVKLEHSRYFFAPIRRRTSSPSSGVRNFSERLRISSMATGSSRKSFLRPTRMMGTPGQRSRTSGCLFLFCTVRREVCFVFGLPVLCKVGWERYGRGVYHFVVILCKESGLAIEKAMRMTWACAYASGRSRS